MYGKFTEEAENIPDCDFYHLFNTPLIDFDEFSYIIVTINKLKEGIDMTKIMVNKKCKQYNKADLTTKKSIRSNIQKLSDKLLLLDKDVNNIFNNDSVIYDRINSEVFIYKCHGINNTQLRIVYGVKKHGDDIIIYLIDFVNKKSNDKEYINSVNLKFKNIHITDLSFCDICNER